jgi:predicted dehydrogenase
VLSTAAIGLKKVIPAMQQGELTTVAAIASRDLAKAREAAAALGIPTAYGSYEELLADPNIDAIYNPLPNQLHVPWTIKAAEAGKHVLCEKPLSLTVAEAETLLAVRAAPASKSARPSWSQPPAMAAPAPACSTRAASASSAPSPASSATSTSTRPTSATRWTRRRRADGHRLLLHPRLRATPSNRSPPAWSPHRPRPADGTDRLTSAILDFPSGQAIFTCSTQLVPYQRIHFLGTKGRIEIEIPSTRPPDRPRASSSIRQRPLRRRHHHRDLPHCDQYTLQGDAFSKAVLDNTEVPVPLEDAIANMAVIEAIFGCITSSSTA